MAGPYGCYVVKQIYSNELFLSTSATLTFTITRYAGVPRLLKR